MTTLTAVVDDDDAAGLLRELFRSPPAAALALATPDDAGPADAVLRWLLVALTNLPEDQQRLLRAGAAQLLGEPAFCGYVLCLLEGEGSEAAVGRATELIAAGALRGVPATAAGGAD